MKKSVWGLLALLTLFLGLVSCEDDPFDNDPYEEATFALCQNIWEDTYVTEDGRDCVQRLTFYSNGNGEDYRIYYSRYGQYLGEERIPVYWDWNNRYYDSLYIEYPDGGVSYMDQIRITPRTLQCLLDDYPVTFKAVY